MVTLIDEYDQPVVNYIDNAEKSAKNREVLRDLFGVLKYSDAYLRFVFLTGVSKFARVSIFSDLNNLRDITLSPQFATLLGYTQAELESHFDHHLHNLSLELGITKAQLLDQIKTWYNGYRLSTLSSPLSRFVQLTLLPLMPCRSVEFLTNLKLAHIP